MLRRKFSAVLSRSHQLSGLRSLQTSFRSNVFHSCPNSTSQTSPSFTNSYPSQTRYVSTSTPPRKSSAHSTSLPLPQALPVDSLPRYPTLSTNGILRGLDYVGTLSFAHTGALLAASSGMDLLGTCMIGTITAIGGGTIRDSVILKKRPFWTEETEYLYLSLAAAGITFALWPRERNDDTITHFVSDALGVAAFCVIGAQNGVRAGVPAVVCMICGMATATFGGVVRDVLCKKDVRILHSHAEVYATTAAGGAASYLAARRMGLNGRVGIGLGVAFGARCWAWMYGTRLPVWTGEQSIVEGDDR